MKKFAFLLFVLFSIAAVQSKVVKDPAGLKAKDFSALSFNRLQSLRKSYIEFLKHAQTRLYGQESFQSQEFKDSGNYTVYTFWQNIYLAHAGEAELCFFGGWPSRMSGAYCQAPWKHRGDDEVKNFGPVYSQEVFCGERDLFRCNPVLFGEGEKTCVRMEGTYANLTDKCEAASADNVEALVEGIKNNPHKARQMEKFNQAIFGEEGFCSTFKAKHNKEYDACDNLRNRINALMDTTSSGQVEEDGSAAPLANPGGESLGILSECAKTLPEDVNARGLVQSLQGGLTACGARMPDQTSELGDLDRVAEEFDKLGFLRQLNLKNFEHKLHALLNIESGFMPEGRSLASQSKDRLFEELANKFPQLKEDEAFKKLFEEVFAKHQELKGSGQLQKVSLEDMADRFKVLANGSPFANPPVKGVNEVCKEINEKFQERHPERDSWVEKALWFSDEEEATIEELRKELNASLNHAVAGSQAGFLLGTEHFQENVMDPTVDFAKECVEDSNYKVLNSTLSERDLEAALGQAQEKILDSFEDLQNSERPFAQERWRMNARENTANNLIKGYLEENKLVVAGVLRGEQGPEQARASRYLCSMIKEIYTRDGRMQAVSWIGAGASLIGGVACVFPVTAPVGCPVMATGTAISTAVGGARAYEGYQLGQASALAQAQHNRDASEFVADRKSASDQFVYGATEVALSKGGLVISGVSKLYRASRAARAADDALESSRSLAATADEAADVNAYLNRETARLLEGPKGTSLQTAGKVEVRFTDPDTGREYVRFIDSRIIAMGDLDDATRIRAIKEVFGERLSNNPEVLREQIEAIMEAHKRFPCAIGKCSARQLREKLEWMRRKGVPDDVASDTIRFGITGHSDDAINAMKGQSATAL